MKMPVLIVLALILPIVTPADWVMEDVIESPQVKFEATIKFKGDKCRMDTPDSGSGPSSLIADVATGEVIHLAHARKELRKVAEASAKNGKDQPKENTAPASNAPPPKATGEKEKIGDWDCEIYTWEDGQNSAKLWVAMNVPKAAEIKAVIKKVNSGPFGLSQSGPDTSVLPGVTVKTEMTMQGSKSTVSVRSIREQDLDPAEFEVPKGYAKKTSPTSKAPSSKSSGGSGAAKKSK